MDELLSSVIPKQFIPLFPQFIQTAASFGGNYHGYYIFYIMPLKPYSKTEPKVFAWIIAPYAVLFNLLIFGGCIFNSWNNFYRSLVYSGLYFVIVYSLFGLVASYIQKRFPGASDLFRRISIMLPVFYVLNAICVSCIMFIYTQYTFVSCPVNMGMLVWAILYGCTMSTVITFVNEGIANWEAWKASLTETEKLKNAYQRSRVYGLRGQINPHFLFNCFNTLSGLIQEDEVKAEKFLDEMTKVHRYLLRSNDELLVTLETEMKFAGSYLYLAKERFGEALKISIDITRSALERDIPPLSMQVILENIIYTNALNKADPLHIHISADSDDIISVVNSIHEKKMVQNYDVDDGLDNLFKKYQLLDAHGITIREENGQRTLLLPLFDHKEVTV